MSRTEELYKEYVVDHKLERAGLFQALRERYQPINTVLYPGCFLHITPSFYFQHIVYVDKNELSRSFFADTEGILRAISAKKSYSSKTYFRFIHQDYREQLALPDESFDLLFALYAGGISRSCARYLKPGAILVTNNHSGDAVEAAAQKDLEPIAVVTEKRDRYDFSSADLDAYFTPKNRGRFRTSPRGGRVEYERTADYYVFQKGSSGSLRTR